MSTGSLLHYSETTQFREFCPSIHSDFFSYCVHKNHYGVPLFEDFLAKAAKLHCQLKATTLASSAYLDSFQKIADVATNTRGATKDIGSALTRICLRHRSVETRLKSYTNCIIESLVMPMQENIEEWRKSTAQLDKEHAKEYKKARHEIKKKYSDTMRLQKKAKKTNTRNNLKKTLDCALKDVNDKFLLLEEMEKQSVRTALIEERSRYCLFVSHLKPVIDQEISLLSEVTHLQEALETLAKHSSDPYNLPSGSEQVITDIKSSDVATWNFQTPPSSPNTGSSIGSRKSSMCSINSLTSSSSSSTKSHSSPSHQHRQFRSVSQYPTIGNTIQLGGTLRLSSMSSQDSGFTSQDTLFLRPGTPISHFNRKVSNGSDNSSSTSTGCTGSVSSMTSSNPSSPYYPATGNVSNATWPLQESSQLSPNSVAGFSHHPTQGISERPHTISSAYEKCGHTRPALTAHTFQPPDAQTTEGSGTTLQKSRDSTASSATPTSPAACITDEMVSQEPMRASVYSSSTTSSEELENNPPVPQKYSESRPQVPVVEDKPQHFVRAIDPYIVDNSTVPDFNRSAPNQILPQPIYMNMDEVAEEKFQPPPPSSLQQGHNSTIRNNHINNVQNSYLGHQRQSSDPQITMKASHTSVISSSGYGSSGNPTPSGSEDTLVCEVSADDIIASLSKYSTLPRNGEWFKNMYRSYTTAMASEHRRPVSATEIGSTATLGCRGANGIRRSTSQANRPPPPVRRTSSITNPNAITIGTLRKCSLQVADGIYGFLPQRQSSNESVNSMGIASEKPKPTGEVVEEDQSQNRANLIQHLNARFAEREVQHKQSLSDTRSSETVSKHNVQKAPHSPKLIGDAIIQKQVNLSCQISRSPIESTYRTSSEQKSHTLSFSERSALMQSLNSKLTQQLAQNVTTGSRRMASPDRLSEHSHHHVNQSGHPHHTQRQFSDPSMSSRLPPFDFSPPHQHPSTAHPHSFKDALKAKLKYTTSTSKGHQQSNLTEPAPMFNPNINASPVRRSISSGSTDPVAERARKWLASRAQAQDVATCRESLLEQIKKGTRLRKVSQSDDRSDPRLS